MRIQRHGDVINPETAVELLTRGARLIQREQALAARAQALETSFAERVAEDAERVGASHWLEIAAQAKRDTATQEQEVVQLAALLAERLVGRQLEVAPEDLERLYADAVARMGNAPRFTLYCCAADRPALSDLPNHIHVEVDSELSRGDLVLQAQQKTVDARVRVRLEALLAAIR